MDAGCGAARRAGARSAQLAGRATGVLFYNTLFDENAASHVALGAAYKFTLRGGETMSDEEFERAGGNRSAAHVDFMIGSGNSMSTACSPTVRVEPVMRCGDWV